MKKLIIPVLAVALIIAACGKEAAKPQTVSITLDSNPTTGFSWQYEIQDKSAVKLVDDEYVPSNTDKKITGAGGMHSFTFACLKDCETSVIMTYKRPWKGGETAEKRLIRIKYKKSGNLFWELEKIQNEE